MGRRFILSFFWVETACWSLLEHMQPSSPLQVKSGHGLFYCLIDMLGYGLAKCAVHHLAKSLSCSSSGLPMGSRVVTAHPKILDTEANRKAMPSADRSHWTPLGHISEYTLLYYALVAQHYIASILGVLLTYVLVFLPTGARSMTACPAEI